jgi:hypothetical protein
LPPAWIGAVATAGLLLLFALWILASLALLCSTRLGIDLHPGHLLRFLSRGSDVGFHLPETGGAASGGPWYAETLYALLPNWQQFWMA